MTKPMEVTEEEARAIVNFLSDMTQYEVGSHGLGYGERVTLQLLYGRMADHIEHLNLQTVKEDITDELE